MYDWSLKKLKRLIAAIIGMTLLVIGVAMIVLPGPAIVVIPLALGILATEFAWARSLLRVSRERILRAASNEANNKPIKAYDKEN